jgi:hypothetical protein
LVFEPGEEEGSLENSKLRIVALVQANVKLDFHMTLSMPCSSDDKNDVEQEYETAEFPNIYFSLIINTEFIFNHTLEEMFTSDIFNTGASYKTDMGSYDLIEFVSTKWFDPKFVIMNNDSDDYDDVLLCCPCAYYPLDPIVQIGSMRVMHTTRRLDLSHELCMIDSDASTE